MVRAFALAAALWLLITGLLSSALTHNLSAAAPPDMIETGRLSAQISSVAVSGSLAVAGDERGILIIDVSDPASPALRSSLDLGGKIADLAIDANLVYAANYSGLLQVIDISDPAAPALRSSLAVSINPNGIDIAGGLAALATYNGGLRIVDISNPDAPALLGEVSAKAIGGSTLDVRISAGRAYVASLAGMAIFDLADPSNPALLGSYDTVAHGFGNSKGLDIVGDRAYLAVSNSGLVAIDVSTPAAPVALGSLGTLGISRAVHVTGSRAYLTDLIGKLYLVDLSDPDYPALITSLDTTGPAGQLAIVGTQAFIAEGSSGMSIIETANDSPQRIGAYQIAGNSLGIATNGDRAYLVGREGLVIADISDPVSPRVLGVLSLPGYAYHVTTSATMAYVSSDLSGQSNDSFIWIIDVSDPTSPQILSSVTITLDAVNDLALLGTTLYVLTNSSGMLLIDVSEPSAPTLLSVPTDLQAINAKKISLSGARAYLSTGQVLDISDPTAPALLGTLSLPNSQILAAVGTTIYVLERVPIIPSKPLRFQTTFNVFDASDLAAPLLLGSYTLDPTMIDLLGVESQRAYLHTTSDTYQQVGVDIVDISDPTQPTLAHRPTLSSVPDFLAFDGGLIYGGGYGFGLRIYRSAPAVTPTDTPTSTPTDPTGEARIEQVYLPLVRRP